LIGPADNRAAVFVKISEITETTRNEKLNHENNSIRYYWKEALYSPRLFFCDLRQRALWFFILRIQA
jgi:hypothetical protein